MDCNLNKIVLKFTSFIFCRMNGIFLCQLLNQNVILLTTFID